MTSYEGYILHTWLIIIGIDLDHLTKVVVVKFLTVKLCFSSSFHSLLFRRKWLWDGKSIVHSKERVNIYTNSSEWEICICFSIYLFRSVCTQDVLYPELWSNTAFSILLFRVFQCWLLGELFQLVLASLWHTLILNLKS